MHRVIIILTFILSACDFNTSQSNNQSDYPSPEELKYKLGDCLYFKTSDTTYGCVVVCDFSKDAGGIWYGVFYSGYDSTAPPTLTAIKMGKVMGRKVQSGLDVEGYKKYVDGDFIHDSLFTNPRNFTEIGNIHIKRETELGSHGAITSMLYLRISFKRRVEVRLKPPDHYSEHLTKLDKFHPEEYFSMSDFIK